MGFYWSGQVEKRQVITVAEGGYGKVIFRNSTPGGPAAASSLQTREENGYCFN